MMNVATNFTKSEVDSDLVTTEAPTADILKRVGEPQQTMMILQMKF